MFEKNEKSDFLWNMIGSLVYAMSTVFMSYLTNDYRRDGLLVDMRFKEVRGSELAFVVTIATPEATDDEFLPLELAVDKGGGISIKVDDDMDLLAGDETDFDEGV